MTYPRDPRTHRVRTFMELGFDLKLAACLADSKDKHGIWVYHKDVKDVIEACVKKGKSEAEARHIAFGIFSDA